MVWLRVIKKELLKQRKNSSDSFVQVKVLSNYIQKTVDRAQCTVLQLLGTVNCMCTI